LGIALAIPMTDPKKFRGNGLHYLLQADSEEENSEERYFGKAVVDNFAPVDEQKFWRQRYFMNDSYYGGKGSPVFIVLGGEGALNNRFVDGRLFVNHLAQQHHAMVIALEHRYYGKSYPTADMSTSNLRFLTSEQALEDAARFISSEEMTSIVGTQCKWIAFGGSYPGNLAAWIRLKYPHLIYASVGSSAPVEAVVDMYQYMDVVGFALKYFGGDKCYDAMYSAQKKIAELIETKEGRDKLNDDFKTCQDLNNNDQYDWANFEGNVMGIVQGVVQYNLDRPSEKRTTVTDVCNFVTRGSDPYTGFVNLTRYEQHGNCLEVSYRQALADLSKTAFDGVSASRQWTYQTCNEFGYYQTTTSQKNPFAPLKYVTLDFYLDQCKNLYGFVVPPPVKMINAVYGSLDLAGTRIVLPNGNIDPWSSLGIQKDAKEPTITPIFIDGTAHCADLYAMDPLDSTALVKARTQIAAQIDLWLH